MSEHCSHDLEAFDFQELKRHGLLFQKTGDFEIIPRRPHPLHPSSPSPVPMPESDGGNEAIKAIPRSLSPIPIHSLPP